jgi:putative transposase
MNLMLINVSTRKLRRAVRLPEGDLPVIAMDGTSKSATSRRFVALSAACLAELMTSDLSKPDLETTEATREMPIQVSWFL